MAYYSCDYTYIIIPIWLYLYDYDVRLTNYFTCATFVVGNANKNAIRNFGGIWKVRTWKRRTQASAKDKSTCNYLIYNFNVWINQYVARSQRNCLLYWMINMLLEVKETLLTVLSDQYVAMLLAVKELLLTVLSE